MADSSLKKKTILLFVSDPIVRSVMQETLELEGPTVLPVGDLGNAVKMIEMIPPDLLIIRSYVESLTGHDAARYLRTKCPNLKVLIVGGFLANDRLYHRQMQEGYAVFPQALPGVGVGPESQGGSKRPSRVRSGT